VLTTDLCSLGHLPTPALALALQLQICSTNCTTAPDLPHPQSHPAHPQLSSLAEDADQRAVDGLDLDNLPVSLTMMSHIGVKLGPSDGNLEAVRGDDTREFSAPVAAQFPPCAVEQSGPLRDGAENLHGVTYGGAADGLPRLQFRHDVGDATLDGPSLVAGVPEATPGAARR